MQKEGLAPVELGPGGKIDRGVLLGYLSGRKIAVTPLIIGERARIRSGTVIYSNVTVGKRLETGHNVIIREETRIGDNVSIWNNTVIDYGCIVGSNVKIHCNVYIAQFTEIGDNVFFGPGVTVANDRHPVCTLCMRGPKIKEGARIGVNVTILPQVIIGEYSLVGAGSVVTKDVPPYTLVYGMPARIAGSVDELKCRMNIVDRPYIYGQDVQLRKAKGGLHFRDSNSR
ncbi:MAG: acyltransferase [PVC group bacterium]